MFSVNISEIIWHCMAVWFSWWPQTVQWWKMYELMLYLFGVHSSV